MAPIGWPLRGENELGEWDPEDELKDDADEAADNDTDDDLWDDLDPEENEEG